KMADPRVPGPRSADDGDPERGVHAGCSRAGRSYITLAPPQEASRAPVPVADDAGRPGRRPDGGRAPVAPGRVPPVRPPGLAVSRTTTRRVPAAAAGRGTGLLHRPERDRAAHVRHLRPSPPRPRVPRSGIRARRVRPDHRPLFRLGAPPG